MLLCFDATRFGCGLDGAVEIAAAKGLSAVEYSFASFSVSNKNGDSLDKKEQKYMSSVRKLGERHGVEITCLHLEECLDYQDKKATRKFVQMVDKLAAVAEAVGCWRISICFRPGNELVCQQELNATLSTLEESLSKRGIKLLLRLSTPVSFRGQSLKTWRAMEPQEWRDILAANPNVGLSFSPADCVWLGIDYLQILPGIAPAIDHVEAHDIEINRTLLNDSGMYGPLWWRYRLPGKGQVDWRQLIEALKLYDFTGSLSIQLDDEFVAGDGEDLDLALESTIKVLAPLVKY